MLGFDPANISAFLTHHAQLLLLSVTVLVTNKLFSHCVVSTIVLPLIVVLSPTANIDNCVLQCGNNQECRSWQRGS